MHRPTAPFLSSRYANGVRLYDVDGFSPLDYRVAGRDGFISGGAAPAAHLSGWAAYAPASIILHVSPSARKHLTVPLSRAEARQPGPVPTSVSRLKPREDALPRVCGPGSSSSDLLRKRLQGKRRWGRRRRGGGVGKRQFLRLCSNTKAASWARETDAHSV